MIKYIVVKCFDRSEAERDKCNDWQQLEKYVTYKILIRHGLIWCTYKYTYETAEAANAVVNILKYSERERVLEHKRKLKHMLYSVLHLPKTVGKHEC